jgi:hypothetical protein
VVKGTHFEPHDMTFAAEIEDDDLRSPLDAAAAAATPS